MIRSQIMGCGAYLPRTVLTNDELAKRVDTSDEWIRERTGIHQRHIAHEGEKTSDLALRRGARALAMRGDGRRRTRSDRRRDHDAGRNLSRHRHDASGAARHDARRRLRRPGGVLGLHLRAVGRGQFHPVGQAKTVLLIGAETMSRLLDWNDRDDLRAVRRRRRRRRAAGRARARATIRTAASSTPSSFPTAGCTIFCMSMAVRPRPRRPAICACRARKSSTTRSPISRPRSWPRLEEAGLTIADIDWFVPHQANQRILDGTARKLGIPAEQGRFDRRPARQHLGRLGAAGAGHGRRGRPHQAGRPGPAGGHGRRLHLGRRPGPLVIHLFRYAVYPFDVDGKFAYRLPFVKH